MNEPAKPTRGVTIECRAEHHTECYGISYLPMRDNDAGFPVPCQCECHEPKERQ